MHLSFPIRRCGRCCGWHSSTHDYADGDLPRPFTSRYDIYVNFPNAPGVSIGTPVRKSGIHIGRVSDVQFLDNDRGVQLTLQIDGERRVFEDELCRISSARS